MRNRGERRFTKGRGEHLELRIAAVEEYGKIVVFCALVLVALFYVATNLVRWLWVVPIVSAFLLENAIKFFILKTYRQKVACYVLDTVGMLALTCLSDGTMISTFYVVILSEFYLNQPKLGKNFFMFCCSSVAFLTVTIVTSVLEGGRLDVLSGILNGLNDIILLVFHFLIFNMSLQIYRKNKEIAQAFDELSESNEKLQAAYEDLKKITALEERQRIAKEIHDTAGHSITTVIMQTEAAKLTIETNPEEAKKRISAANIQAKNALEELRQSVHLLSGVGEYRTLKDALLAVVHDSTDGTGVTIRSEIEDITLSTAKSRLILNSLKEGISNGLRHGGATAFWFELKRADGKVTFFLSDNGTGMGEKMEEGFGLSGMRTQAERLGGKVYFTSEVGEGFEIALVLPDGEREEEL